MKKYGKMIKTKTKPNASVSMKISDIRDEDAAECLCSGLRSMRWEK